MHLTLVEDQQLQFKRWIVTFTIVPRPKLKLGIIEQGMLFAEFHMWLRP